MIELPPDIASASTAVQDRYLALVSGGTEPRLAEMFALHQSPGARTDREFFRDRGTLANQFKGNEDHLGVVVRAAKRKGYQPNANDYYEPSLANSIGDPSAFISPSGGRTQLRRELQSRGIEPPKVMPNYGQMEGATIIPAAPVAAGRLGHDIVADIAEQKIKENPDLARIDPRDLAAEIQLQHGYTDERLVGQITE